MPDVRQDHLDTPSPLNPLGVKGLGEGGTLAPPAVLAAAVEDALAPLGVEVDADAADGGQRLAADPGREAPTPSRCAGEARASPAGRREQVERSRSGDGTAGGEGRAGDGRRIRHRAGDLRAVRAGGCAGGRRRLARRCRRGDRVADHGRKAGVRSRPAGTSPSPEDAARMVAETVACVRAARRADRERRAGAGGDGHRDDARAVGARHRHEPDGLLPVGPRGDPALDRGGRRLDRADGLAARVRGRGAVRRVRRLEGRRR